MSVVRKIGAKKVLHHEDISEEPCGNNNERHSAIEAVHQTECIDSVSLTVALR